MTSESESPDRSSRPDRGFLVAYVLPSLLLLSVVVLPLVLGSRTLFFRDIFNTHLEMKWWQAEAMNEGYLPLVDPYRTGGQPHVGNPNTVALYPDNVFYLVAPVVWSLNAHFWLHWLLAPVALYWLGRRLGLGPPGAWAAGVFYALSGYFLSNLNLYNLIAGVALIPALAASILALADRSSRSRWRLAATAGLWCLLVLAGDPMTAAVGLALGLSVLLIEPPDRRGALRVGAAIAAGSLLAAPQLVEFWRILELSFRGHWGYSEAGATMSSWHPATVIEWLIPLAFGPPDLTFWGQRFHSGTQPLLYSSYPGLVALICLGLGVLRPRRRMVLWALAVMAGGLFVALGGYNPAVRWLVSLSGSNLLRLPIKFWPLVAIPAALVAGVGFDRALLPRSSKLVRRLSLAFLATYALVWVTLTVSGSAVEGLLAGWMPEQFEGSPLAQLERQRWASLSLQAAGLALAIALATVVRAGAFARLGPLVLAVHVCLQLVYLRPLYRMDETEAYRTLPASLARVPEEGRVVHGAARNLFGKLPVPILEYQSPHPRWMQRQFHDEAYPHTGMMARRHYDFHLSPEGLDSFLTRATTEALPLLSDDGRLRLLEASGVEWLFMKRELDDTERAVLVGRYPSLGEDLLLYRIPGAAPEVLFAGDLIFSESLGDAVATITSAEFDPLTQVVIAGRSAPGAGGSGTVEPLERNAGDDVESWRWRVRADGRGAFLVQKAHLPIYRIAVDGKERAPLAANMHRMAVLLEAGEHTVRLWVDRRPFRFSVAVAAAAFLGLLIYGWLGRGLGRGDSLR